VLNRHDQPAAAPEAPSEEQLRRPRRMTRPPGEAGEKARVRARADGSEEAPRGEGAAPADAKAAVKRVRKAGTTDAAAS